MTKPSEWPEATARFARRAATTIGGELQEAAAVVTAAALYPAGWFDRGPGGPAKPTLRVVGSTASRPLRRASGWDTPVLLVHGWLANKSNWLVVERELRRAGFDDIHAMNYRPFPLDVEMLGQQCVERAREVMEECGTDHIHLVGHSLGGLVARWAVQLGGLHEALTVQTVASPHGGVPLANLNRGAKATEHIAEGAPMLRRLDCAPAPPMTSFVAYWSEFDAIVPSPRAEISAPQLRAENVHLPRRGHLGIVLSRRLGASIAERAALAERDARRVGRRVG